VQLLDPRSEAFSPRQAWLRLWVLAGDQPRLNGWEQHRAEPGLDAQAEALFALIDDEKRVPLEVAQTQPLALVRALDRWLAAMQRPAGRTLATGHAQTPYTEEGQGYWLVPVFQAARQATAMARQDTQRARWFRHHAAIPCRTSQHLEVSLQACRGLLDEALSDLAGGPAGELKTWVAHFNDGADVEWTRNVGKAGNWRTLSVEPAAHRLASIAGTLQRAQDGGAVVVVFPEFTIDLQQRQAIAEHLIQHPNGSVQLVVAGSFHEPEAGGDPLQAYNTAPVLVANGQTLFKHRKLRLFGDDAHGAECALIGNALHVLLTPLGGMTVMICKDYLDGDDRVRTALHEVPVDWVWVPSYGNEKTLTLHKQRARELAIVRAGLSTLVAQTQNTAMDKNGCALPGFGHAAGQGEPNDVGAEGGLVNLAWRRLPAPDVRPGKGRKPSLKRVK
jgi:predicted amidohydrolase